MRRFEEKTMTMDNAAAPITEIAPSSTVNDVVREFPGTLEVFRQLGVDTCCGGGATLEQAARNLQVLPDTLIQTLQVHARTWQEVPTVQPARHLRNAPCNCHL
jgi:iron-sulfur cluster repair protein YtfE (RIC family)